MTSTNLTGRVPPPEILQLSSAGHGEQHAGVDRDEQNAAPNAGLQGGGSLYSKRRTAHAKAILPPRINLRRAASYNVAEKGPLSSTSSRFSFNHLVFSPPPSPGLPSLSPPKKPPQRKLILGVRPIRLIRYTIRILSILAVFWISLEVLTYLFGPEIPIPADNTRLSVPEKPIVAPPKRSDGVEMVSQKGAPDFATPIVITDHRGKAKWTVSIPPGTPFPLSQKGYADMCGRCEQVAARAVELRSQGSGLPQVSLSFGAEAPDHDFIDVQEAEKAGYLPKRGAGGTNTGKPVCKKSLTFVLESSEAGLGKTLMMLWIAYGLAEKEGRGFFIDDTRWAYGEYSDIFEAPPAQDCSPPPDHERLPCPPQARHLVVSAANAHEVFANLLPPSAEGIFSSSSPPLEPLDPSLLKKQFALARSGFRALFHLNAGDARHVDARTRKLLAKRLVPKTKGTQSGLSIGLHIRRGDRHPFEPQYRRSYLPVNVYTDFAQEIIASKFNSSGSIFHDTAEENRLAREHSFMILASDDPLVYDSEEVKDNLNGKRVVRAQDRIKLASKHELLPKGGKEEEVDRNVMHKFVDEAFGWEGGFYAGMFWNLGVPTANNDKKEEKGVGAESLRLRSLVGRAYMMDLAVLAEASDVVVCTVSSLGCRLLGVMMGEGSVKGGRWVNVDGGLGWLGLD
ncbi:hypothetical protein QC762_104480 [Podospora pseudocomata]|uniref:Uncharacterized protein n=1 Tax=Podospora pseudocomata TaxID=2093779 RepID=A0ABR0GSM9_9PEZI|nr:hypothetical protein QC762_104480 [Podospora pseudocomata]